MPLKTIAIAAIVLAAAGGAYLLLSSPFQAGSELKPTREFTIEVRIYESGSFNPKEIKVKRGEIVALHLRAIDVPHGFKIEGYDLDPGLLKPGSTKTVIFKADKPGHFDFFCTVVCSAQHDLQRGALIVED